MIKLDSFENLIPIIDIYVVFYLRRDGNSGRRKEFIIFCCLRFKKIYQMLNTFKERSVFILLQKSFYTGNDSQVLHSFFGINLFNLRFDAILLMFSFN